MRRLHAVRALLDNAEGTRAPAAAPVVRTFGFALLADCAERWKPVTSGVHSDGMSRFTLPALGDRRVDALTAKDVRNWFDDLSVTRQWEAENRLESRRCACSCWRDAGRGRYAVCGGRKSSLTA